jgi:asparagine synthase (glutamine-hydrolysing)
MCGISGFFSTTPQPANIVGRMTDLIRHRGPDDEGFVLFQTLSAMPRVCGGQDTPDGAYQAATVYALKEKLSSLGAYPVTLALGHRRLSIVDLSPMGHQPMSSADGRYWIVYNGEVYNHVELRAELDARGYQFVSHSDTEVIIAAYREWGKECLARFNGMFAFLIYDRAQRKLFVARDRFGVKPLYYRVSGNGFAFASEIKQFTVLPDWRAQMNGQRVYDFLNWGITDHTDETLFAGVFQLRGGQALELDLQAITDGRVQYAAGGKLPVYSWYQLKPQPFVGTMEDASAQFRNKLIDAVKLHLRADVPVGSCLSGGLDSSSIVCIVNQLLREEDAHGLQKTFSACSDVGKFDERKWIDVVVDATGVEGHYVYPALSGLFDEVPAITWHQDEPFGSTSIYAQWSVFRLAAEQKVKVMLDGQGADEQLAGYHVFFGPYLATVFRSLHWLDLINEASAMRRLHGYSYTTALAYLANFTLPEFIKDPLRRATGRAGAQPAWLNFEQLNCVAVNPFQAAGAAEAETVQRLSIAQLTASNLQMLLHWEDRDSMGHSIESRVPFLDYRLVEFVLGLPDEYKLSDGVTKRVLRQGMSGILPDAIRDRMDKLGFVTPEETWLRETASELFREKLQHAIEASGGILRKDEASKMLEDMISGSLRFSYLPWRMISFGEWVKQFAVTVPEL